MGTVPGRTLLLLWLPVLLCGCGGPTVAIPKYDPEKLLEEIFQRHDTNKDAKLDAAELKGSGSLLNALPALDRNNDKALDREELEASLREFAQGTVGLQNIQLGVFRGGQPLAGATVSLTPEPFMGAVIKPASGVTDAGGNVQPRTADAPYPGIQLGFYRVAISLKDAAGKELVPSQYNEKTTLGLFMSPRQRSRVEYRLDGGS